MSDRQNKRDLFQENNKSPRRFLVPGALVLLVVISLCSWFLLGAGKAQGITTVSANTDGSIRLLAAGFNDGQAQFFRYQGQSGPIDFFVVKSHDGVIRAAFDSCDVCYKEKKGYRQEGDAMVCNNCGQSFRSDLINQVKGGCNPAPLQRQLAGDQLIIQVASLDQGAKFF